jgi:hypothetical protein
MTRRLNAEYSSFSTDHRRRFGVNLLLRLDHLAQSPAADGWSAVMALICLLLPPSELRLDRTPSDAKQRRFAMVAHGWHG